MSSAQIEIQIIAIVVAIACAIPGVFLVLRKMAMISDAISHSILFGVVIGFFLIKDLNSPLLVISAGLTGVLTVFLVEVLIKSNLVKEDASIGLVFPFLFSIGVILISKYAGNIHLDIDSVILGELVFAPFNRLVISGYDIGPVSLYKMLVILILNIIFVLVFYKELKISIFDEGLSKTLGFSPIILHYSLMSVISITAVGAFDVIGSVLVVALMIISPATAYLISENVQSMIITSVLVAIISSISGYWVAHYYDASIAGSMCIMAGVCFFVVLFFAPEKGIISSLRLRYKQKLMFFTKMLTVHLLQHEKSPDELVENSIEHLHKNIKWDIDFSRKVIKYAINEKLVVQKDNLLELTEKGRELALESILK